MIVYDGIDATIQGLQTFAAFLSIAGCSIVFSSIWRSHSYNSWANQLLIYLLILQIGLAIVYGVGQIGIQSPGFCAFQVCLHHTTNIIFLIIVLLSPMKLNFTYESFFIIIIIYFYIYLYINIFMYEFA